MVVLDGGRAFAALAFVGGGSDNGSGGVGHSSLSGSAIHNGRRNPCAAFPRASIGRAALCWSACAVDVIDAPSGSRTYLSFSGAPSGSRGIQINDGGVGVRGAAVMASSNRSPAR